MESELSRYSRHTLLRVFGPEGQARLASARVLVPGVGALGATIAGLLVRAGVGFVRIIDRDAPELHNLHRQVLYTENDVTSGRSKVEAAADRLREANSEVTIEAVQTEIGPGNVDSLVDGTDLVVDGLDNMQTRYPLNDVCIERRVPYVFAGAVETAGNVMTIIPGSTPCLRCLWPDPDRVASHAKASTVGVLSSVASLIASIQVTEAIKILAGKEHECLKGLLVIDAWRQAYQVVPVERSPECVCSKVIAD